jgi:hypothetical protein
VKALAMNTSSQIRCEPDALDSNVADLDSVIAEVIAEAEAILAAVEFDELVARLASTVPSTIRPRSCTIEQERPRADRFPAPSVPHIAWLLAAAPMSAVPVARAPPPIRAARRRGCPHPPVRTARAPSGRGGASFFR